ncbi:MAG: hypothetical protein ABL958_20590 [Bdellovibrionia bacterium]
MTVRRSVYSSGIKSEAIKPIAGVPAFTADKFAPEASSMRAEFLGRMDDPGSSKRFVWDHWHIPGQYTLIRTPAYHFFTQALYKKFHERLLAFGREHLGCYNVTPPWLSYYVEGCRQDLHADVPHGPWAFVYSLTDWEKRGFEGGETLILKSTTLDYWRHFSEFNGVESGDLVAKVPAKFNRLLVFDPRVPHGVTPVHGVHDPRRARLVIHGWFTDPEPYVVGKLTRKQATAPLNELIGSLETAFSRHGHLHGSLSLRFEVSPAGRASAPKLMTNTLISREGLSSAAFLREIRAALAAQNFPRAAGSTSVTLPLVFR